MGFYAGLYGFFMDDVSPGEQPHFSNWKITIFSWENMGKLTISTAIFNNDVVFQKVTFKKKRHLRRIKNQQTLEFVSSHSAVSLSIQLHSERRDRPIPSPPWETGPSSSWSTSSLVTADRLMSNLKTSVELRNRSTATSEHVTMKIWVAASDVPSFVSSVTWRAGKWTRNKNLHPDRGFSIAMFDYQMVAPIDARTPHFQTVMLSYSIKACLC